MWPEDYGLVYLASPYSKFSKGRVAAFEEVCKLAARMIHDGFFVYAPIAHSHPIATIGSGRFSIDPDDYSVWLRQDFELIERCDSFFVVGLEGWQLSHGVGKEVERAINLGKPIYLIDPAELKIEKILVTEEPL